MRPFLSLVNIIVRQMLRSKALWIIIGIFAIMAMVYFYNQSQFNRLLDEGISYDMATQQASGMLDRLARQIRGFSMIFVILISALVAPESRKNGTTQFVLSMQVSRLRLGIAQFIALSLFIAAAVFIIHIGFSIFAIQVDYFSLWEFFFSWFFLLVPLLLTAAVSFTLSLAFSSIIVYLIIFGIPSVLLNILNELIGWKDKEAPLFLVQLIDNISLLFPEPESLIFWPFMGPDISVSGPPYPIWIWSILNAIFVVCFWLLLAYAFYRNFNIGSRRPLK